jgi:DnaJ-class molecular chaperone
MKEYYKILNLNESATNEEIEKAYKELKEKYQKERFLEGEEGNNAAKNLTKLETAYQEITNARKVSNDSNESDDYDFSQVEKFIKENRLNSAQDLLDTFNNRNAEWHYLQSVIFYKKNWINESKKQLEIAMNMDPHNEKYSNSYTKLKLKIEYNDKQFHSTGTNYGSGVDASPQMGGTDNSCFNYCMSLCCMNLMCNMCCR